MTMKINVCLVLFLATCMMVDSWEVSRRVFDTLGCKGVHDKSKFARLVRLCRECYFMYDSIPLHIQCRSNCFKNDIFGQCLKSLMYSDEEEKLQGMVNYLRGDD